MCIEITYSASLYLLSILFLKSSVSYSQDFNQTIKGYVTDAESKKPLAGITILFQPGAGNVVTDSTGFYSFKHAPVSGYQVQYTGIGYETRVLSDIVLSSGKEPELNISLFTGPTFNFVTHSNDKGKDLVGHYLWSQTKRDQWEKDQSSGSPMPDFLFLPGSSKSVFKVFSR